MDLRITRRRFIKSVIASGVVATGSGRAWARLSESGGAVERLISLQVNGRTRRVDVLPQEMLSHTLRYKLGLIGTKISCNRG